MAITRFPPNTIKLAGSADLVTGSLVNDINAGVATIKPGMLIEMFDDSGILAWRPNSSATNVAAPCVALDQPEFNLGVDALYNDGDRVQAWFMRAGQVWWGLLPSGQNITAGDLLQSNGDGLLKEATSAAASAGVARFQSLETLGAITTVTRCRVQVIW